jgi:hypothetical protein
MITLDGETLVLDHSQAPDDIAPLLAPGKGHKPAVWYVELQISETAVKNYLIDAEILAEEFPIRYLNRKGQSGEGQVLVAELISGPEGDLCLLHGIGKPPAEFLADAPGPIE